MKKLLQLITLLFMTTIIFSKQISAQSTCSWAKKAGGTNTDFGVSVAADAFGNVYYLGNFYSATLTFGSTVLQNQPAQAFNYGAEMYLVKYDSCGTLKWAKKAGGNSETRGRRVTVDATGNIYVTGYSNADTVTFGTQQLINSAGYDIGFVVKYASNGTALWAKQASGYNNRVRSYAITTDASNNVYFTGYFSSTHVKIGADSVLNEYGQGNAGVFIAKLDNNGNVQWIRAGGGDYDVFSYGIGTDVSGNVYVGGTFGSSYIRFGNDSIAKVGYNDIFVVKYNTNGTEQWLRAAGSTGNDQLRALAADPNGNVYITGFIGYSATVAFGTQSITNNSPSYEMFLTKYDAAGTAQWARLTQGDSYSDNEGYGITLDAAANPIVIGFYSSDVLNMGSGTTLDNNALLTAPGLDTAYDIFAAKYKANGTFSWARTVGGIGNDFGYGISASNHGGLYITGEFASPTISFAGITLNATAGSIAGSGDAFISNNIATSPVTPAICMVTVDLLSINNEIYWDKTLPEYSIVDSFVIYRYDIVTSGYLRLGAVSIDSLSMFTDTYRNIGGPNGGDPQYSSYQYKMAILDKAGNMSALSPYHQSIFIQQSNQNFSWNAYTIEGSTSVSGYQFLRDDNNTGIWQPLVNTAGLATTDPNFASFPNGNWRVQAFGLTCDPTRASINTTRSNIKHTSVATGINPQEILNGTNIYPNPASENVSIELPESIQKATIKIMNSIGQLIFEQSVVSSGNSKTIKQINTSAFTKGVYTIIIESNKAKTYKKLVIN